MASKPILTYFNGRGRAELTRLVFAEGNIEYEDRRVSSEGHSGLKTQGVLPFGQLPILEHNGVTLAQSHTVARYAARLGGLYGKDALEGAKIDMLVDGMIDLGGAIFAAKTDEQKEVLKKETLPLWFGHFEKILKSNAPNKVFVGDKTTLGDLAVFRVTDDVLAQHPDALNSFPNLKSHHDHIAASPRIAAWLKKRPQTGF